MHPRRRLLYAGYKRTSASTPLLRLMAACGLRVKGSHSRVSPQHRIVYGIHESEECSLADLDEIEKLAMHLSAGANAPPQTKLIPSIEHSRNEDWKQWCGEIWEP